MGKGRQDVIYIYMYILPFAFAMDIFIALHYRRAASIVHLYLEVAFGLYTQTYVYFAKAHAIILFRACPFR
jgi:hypothetical protein